VGIPFFTATRESYTVFNQPGSFRSTVVDQRFIPSAVRRSAWGGTRDGVDCGTAEAVAYVAVPFAEAVSYVAVARP
jgi:hypothetical protein